ncbi:DUF2203 domain-containing protein [Streptosporangium roseum]|uniref:DUF2203 domain-containing protein n=1 Tax=Streptosporangium roseum (strain ATCC 12428 / DSM 43021 / JCM 3005 / KCTC 9067 / NCIMB 10171 / NRRL 2505 / NI 9100) TaxID=479432 RepID=D2ATR8_STRRD|nr:DUF2203 domain-containing protein [Streptosporangium roseum]ACZ86788.1 conserved hypothetical protein [Streptosporangium roseum DSM 43021]
MGRIFTVEEARALMPALLERADEFVSLRGDLAELVRDLREHGVSESGGLPEAKAFEARLDEILGWFEAHGIEIKGVAPLLVDFPSVLDGVSVRLCWLEGDRDLAWYHREDLGFAGRRPLRRA